MAADLRGDFPLVSRLLRVVRKSPDSTYMHVTNHLLSPKYLTTEPDPSVGNPKSKSWWRYEVVRDYLSGKKGVVTLEEA